MNKNGKTKKWLWVLVGIGIGIAYYFITANLAAKFIGAEYDYLISDSLAVVFSILLSYILLPLVAGIILFLARKDKFKYIGGGLIIAFGIEMLMGFLYGL